MDVFLNLLLDSLLDCLKLVPFLLVTVFLMEYLEHRAGEHFVTAIQKSGRFGPLLGAALGCVPQCGFSAACAELFNGGLVTAGTVAAVFLSTSDEALPILLSHPEGLGAVLPLIVSKVVIAILAGILLDTLWPRRLQQLEYSEHAEPHNCTSDSKLKNIFLAALRHVAEIFVPLFLFTFLITLVVHFIGENRFAALLLPGPCQPLVASLIGLIPNCAASVLLTQLYLDRMISFGAAIAGLCSSAGIGLLVLFRGHRRKRDYLFLIGYVVLCSCVCGELLQIFV